MCNLSQKSMMFCGTTGRKPAAMPRFSRCLERSVLFSAQNSHVFTEKTEDFFVMNFDIDV